MPAKNPDSQRSLLLRYYESKILEMVLFPDLDYLFLLSG